MITVTLFGAMRRNHALRALGAGVLALALAGCMKVDMSLDVGSDDTVDGTIIFGVERSMADMMGGADSMAEEMLGDTTGLPEGATTEPWEDDDYVGVQATFEDAPLDEFSEGGFSIVHEGDEFVVTGEADMTGATEGLGDLGTDLGTESGSDLGDLGDLEDSLEGMTESFDIKISMTFPGEIIETNGEVDGTTVTWRPAVDGPSELTARAKDSGGAGGLPIWAWILIGVAVIGAVVALLFFFSRSKSKPADAVPGDGGEPVPPTAPPAPPGAPAAPTYPQDVAANVAETPAPTAEAAAAEVASHIGDPDAATSGTPAGAETSELPVDATKPIEVPPVAEPPASEPPAPSDEPPAPPR